MSGYGTYNDGLYITHIIERAISIVGERVIELGSGNGRLMNWLHEIGINAAGYDNDPQKQGRYCADKIMIKDVTEISKGLSGDICLAFNFFEHCNVYDEMYKQFKVIIGSTTDKTIVSENARWVNGHNGNSFFVDGTDKDLIDYICDDIVIDYYVVGRFGMTPSMRVLVTDLRKAGFRVHTSLPRLNPPASYKWLRTRCRIHNVLINNTADWEPELRTQLNKDGVGAITVEDGWIPHYDSLHFDNRGFSWNSTVPFTSVYDYEPIVPKSPLKYDMNNPGGVNGKFVFFPLQTRGDSTILHGCHIKNLEDVIRKVRSLIPEGYQLVIKNHPKERHAVNINTDNVVTVNTGLGWLLENAELVVGINSTVLLEASLLYNKPVYYFGKSWYDNHEEVCKHHKLDTPLFPYEVDQHQLDYRKRFWGLLSSKQYDYSAGRDGKQICKIIKNQFMPYKKFCIYLVTHGDEFDFFKKCFDSIIKHTDLSQVNFIIGANGVSDKIKNYVRFHMNDHEIYPIFYHTNHGKAHMTQRVLLTANSDYMISIDDDSYVTNDNWLSFITDTVEKTKDAHKLWGRQYGVGFGPGHSKFLRLCKWWPNDFYKHGDRSPFIQGSLYCADMSYLLSLRYPDDRLKTRSDDVMMGIAIKASGSQFMNLNMNSIAVCNTSKIHRGIR